MRFFSDVIEMNYMNYSILELAEIYRGIGTCASTYQLEGTIKLQNEDTMETLNDTLLMNLRYKKEPIPTEVLRSLVKSAEKCNVFNKPLFNTL
jgi:hypothetical protein